MLLMKWNIVSFGIYEPRHFESMLPYNLTHLKNLNQLSMNVVCVRWDYVWFFILITVDARAYSIPIKMPTKLLKLKLSGKTNKQSFVMLRAECTLIEVLYCEENGSVWWQRNDFGFWAWDWLSLCKNHLRNRLPNWMGKIFTFEARRGSNFSISILSNKFILWHF